MSTEETNKQNRCRECGEVPSEWQEGPDGFMEKAIIKAAYEEGFQDGEKHGLDAMGYIPAMYSSPDVDEAWNDSDTKAALEGTDK